MHIQWKHVAVALAVLPVAAVLFAWIGFFNVGASTGHWKITEWFLHFAMRSAVRTYALAVDVPDELPRHAVQPAAGHFARGCAVCHGAPGEPRSPVALRMLPQPPDLVGVVQDWRDAELFRIVKHGVRFTGMPAWPTQNRDDEVWAMVAFLRELPAMDEMRYRELAYGGERPESFSNSVAQRVADCARCHGEDGMGRSPVTPIIAGQNEAYLLESLRAYAAGSRSSGFMSVPLSSFKPDEVSELARYFSNLPRAVRSESETDLRLAQQGEHIARNGLPAVGVPACLSCHDERDRNPHYPDIAGQPAEYVEAQLRLFAGGKRGGTRYSHLMVKAAQNLTNEDIRALAAFFSGTP